MIKVKFFNSIIEAELTKNLLKTNGIEGFVNQVGIKFPGDRGAELLVTEKDVEKAKEILETYAK